MKNKTKYIKLFIILFIATLLCVLIWSFRYEFTSQGFGVFVKDTYSLLFKQDKFPINFVNDPKIINNVSQRVVVVTDKNFSMFNPVGSEVLNEKYASSDPVIKSNGNYYIVYSPGSSTIFKYSGSSLSFKEKIDGNIVSADITSHGYMAITYYNGIKYSLVIYDSVNDELLKYNTESFVLTDVSLSESGKSVALCCIYLNNGTLSSKVRVIRIYDGTDISSTEYFGELLVKCKLQDDNSFTAITNKTLYIGGKQAPHPEKIENYLIYKNGDAVVVCDKMRFYKSNGTFTAEAEKPDNIKKMYPCKNGFIVFCNNYAHHYDNNMKEVASMFTPGAIDIALTNKYLYFIDSATLNRVPFR